MAKVSCYNVIMNCDLSFLYRRFVMSVEFKAKIKTLMIILFICATASFANFGVGIGFGEPSGLKIQYDINSGTVLNVDIGYNFLFGNSGATLGADIWFLNDDLLIIDRKRYPVFVGVGFQDTVGNLFQDNQSNSFGVKVPVGLLIPVYLENRHTLRVIIQAGPLLNVSPSFGISATLGVGAVYRF